VRRLAEAHRGFVVAHGLTDHGLQPDDEGAQGISHALMAERYALPGELIVGTDSHTPHSGALGCVAFGVGTTDMANAFMTGAVRRALPEVLRIEVDGALPPGVGRVFEFGGAGVRRFSNDERATLTNMTAELGGFTGLVEPDEETLRFLRERRGVDFRLEDWMRSDAGAHYADTLRIDATALSPMVARPGDPGLRVAPGVTLYLQFGTADVREHCERQGWIATFEAVGAQRLQPASGACANCGPAASTAPEQVTLSEVNRNFPGRSGPGQVWLASPATVAASAIAGKLCSFGELLAQG